MWRPDNWEKLSAEKEVGADIMLKALRSLPPEGVRLKRARLAYEEGIRSKPAMIKSYGWLIYIPDKLV